MQLTWSDSKSDVKESNDFNEGNEGLNLVAFTIFVIAISELEDENKVDSNDEVKGQFDDLQVCTSIFHVCPHLMARFFF